jgi:hypothetical protein
MDFPALFHVNGTLSAEAIEEIEIPKIRTNQRMIFVINFIK